jgi:hypothetical protein
MFNVFENNKIRQRSDGYFSAIDMCKIFNKEFKYYKRLPSTQEYLRALGEIVGLSHHLIIETNRGRKGSTWIHPKLAYHLAMWLSPKFAIYVTNWIERFIKGDLDLIPEIIKNNETVTGTKITSFEYIAQQKELLEIEERKHKLEIEKLDLKERQLKCIDKNKDDCHKYTALKNDFINNSNQTTEEDDSDDLSNDVRKNKDISTLCKEELGYIPNQKHLQQLGKKIAEKFRNKYDREPVKTSKHANSAIRDVCVYTTEDYPWIRKIIQNHDFSENDNKGKFVDLRIYMKCNN